MFEDLRKGNLERINSWNREHIWKHGRLYPSDVLLQKVLDEPFDPLVYTSYLENKVRDVYGIR